MQRRLGLLAGLVLSVAAPAAAAPPPPVVILLPDATGDEGRAEAYVDALAARGIASLVLGIEEQEEAPRASTSRAVVARLPGTDRSSPVPARGATRP